VVDLLQSKEEFLKDPENKKRYKLSVSCDIPGISSQNYELSQNAAPMHLVKAIKRSNPSLKNTEIVSMLCHVMISFFWYGSLISQSLLVGVL